MLESEQ